MLTLRLQTMSITVIYASLIYVIFSLCITFYCSQGKKEEEAKENHFKIKNCIFLLAVDFPDNYKLNTSQSCSFYVKYTPKYNVFLLLPSHLFYTHGQVHTYIFLVPHQFLYQTNL